MAQIEVADGNVGWDEKHFPAPPPVPGYAPRMLSEHERALEGACTRLTRDEASTRMVCDAIEEWARGCARDPHFANPRHIDVIVRYLRTKARDFIERKYSPAAIVDETRALLKTAGLDPG
ncbi:MAG: hypothetical protein ACYCZ0_01070 [Minisyncoccota bacterium]